MKFWRAFTYPFDDKDWLEKLAIMAMLTLFSAIPLVGLVGLVILFGYVIEIVGNVREGRQVILPKWIDFNRKVTAGVYLFIAWFVYHIPVMILGGCSFAFAAGAGGSFIVSGISLLVLCCALPLLILYEFFTWPMLAIGLTRYTETGQGNVYFRFGELFETLQENGSLTMQWIVYTIALSLVISVLWIIPCIGWAAALGLSFPAQGYLIGQYASELDMKFKRKPPPQQKRR